MRNLPRTYVADRALAPVVGAVRIVRPLTCVMSGISAVYGCWFARPPSGLDAVTCLLAALAMATMMGFAHTVNDVADVAVDRLTKPDRPIPSGRLGRRAAGVLAGVLAVVALACSAALGAASVAGTAVLLGLGLGYSLWWKGTVLVGNVVVGAVCAATIVFGASATGAVTAPVLGAAAVIFLFMVAYELVKTLQDRAADTAARLVTLATRHGARATVRAYVTAAAVLSVTALAAGVLTSTRPVLYAAAVIVCVLAPVWTVAVLLVRTDGSPRAIVVALTVLRIAWLPALSSLILLQ